MFLVVTSLVHTTISSEFSRMKIVQPNVVFLNGSFWRSIATAVVLDCSQDFDNSVLQIYLNALPVIFSIFSITQILVAKTLEDFYGSDDV